MRRGCCCDLMPLSTRVQKCVSPFRCKLCTYTDPPSLVPSRAPIMSHTAAKCTLAAWTQCKESLTASPAPHRASSPTPLKHDVAAGGSVLAWAFPAPLSRPVCCAACENELGPQVISCSLPSAQRPPPPTSRAMGTARKGPSPARHSRSHAGLSGGHTRRGESNLALQEH